MKYGFSQFPYPICLIVILTGIFAACEIADLKVVAEFRVPDIPSGLGGLSTGLYWKISGSCLVECEARSGEMLKLTGEWHGQGDWILAIPCLRKNCLEAVSGEIGLPAYGWVSNQADPEMSPQIILEAGAGLVAMILRDVERGNGVWAGLNTERLLSNLSHKKLNTANVEYGRLLGAILRREISVYDCSGRKPQNLLVLLPEGNWCDGSGVFQAKAPPGGAIVEISLYSGVNNLFRSFDGALLRLSLTENPDGNFQVLSVLHEPIQGKSTSGDFP